MSHAVLVVDDEQSILRSIKRLLRRDDLEVHVAESGPAALEILAETEVAVIICDQRMPGMSGAEVLAESAKTHPDAYRITLTGHTDLNAAQASINDGKVNHFLLKPWDDDYLRKVVLDGVRSYQLIQDNHRLQALTRQQKAELETWNQQLEAQVRERTEALRAQNASLLELQRRLEESLRDTVGMLARSLEAYSPSLGIHSKRVAELARRLGSRLDLEDRDLRDLEFAAWLHDMGKISKLHSQAARQSRRSGARRQQSFLPHSDSGYAILSQVAGFEDIAWAVRYQDERYDGEGHPEGLKGEEIPLASRIIAVVNAYDEAVFTTANPTTVSREAGRRALLEGQNRRFDPNVVAVLLQYLTEAEGQTSADAEVELSPKQVREGMILSRDIESVDGVLLLKKGTHLTLEMIARIRSLSEVNPLLTSVFVKCAPEPGDPDESHPSQESQQRKKPRPGPDHPSSQARPNRRGGNVEDINGQDDRTTRDLPSKPENAQASPAGPSAETHTPKARALIVDDSRLICNALRRELRPVGIESVATSSGLEALNLVGQEDFDVAIVDLAMPSMSGRELIERLQDRAPNLPCLIVTGNASRQDVLQLSKAPNVVGILAKPWDGERLIATITSAVAHRDLEQPKDVV